MGSLPCLYIGLPAVSLGMPFVTTSQLGQGVTELAVTVLSNLETTAAVLDGIVIKTCGDA